MSGLPPGASGAVCFLGGLSVGGLSLGGLSFGVSALGFALTAGFPLPVLPGWVEGAVSGSTAPLATGSLVPAVSTGFGSLVSAGVGGGAISGPLAAPSPSGWLSATGCAAGSRSALLVTRRSTAAETVAAHAATAIAATIAA